MFATPSTPVVICVLQGSLDKYCCISTKITGQLYLLLLQTSLVTVNSLFNACHNWTLGVCIALSLVHPALASCTQEDEITR